MKKFNKLRKVLVLITMSMTTFFIYKITNKNNINYLSLGDSISLGINSFGELDYSYSDYVKDYLKDNHKLKYYTNQFSNKYLSINDLYKDILINKEIITNNKKLNLKKCLRESNILTLSIGINDIIYRLNITENLTDYKINKIIKDINESFNILIKEIKKYYKYKIYVIGYYNIYPKNDTYNYTVNKLNNKLRENKDIVFIDINDKINLKNYQISPYNYHINSEGYKKISNLIIEKLKNDLKSE